jgi:hypothetical protein
MAEAPKEAYKRTIHQSSSFTLYQRLSRQHPGKIDMLADASPCENLDALSERANPAPSHGRRSRTPRPDDPRRPALSSAHAWKDIKTDNYRAYRVGLRGAWRQKSGQQIARYLEACYDVETYVVLDDNTFDIAECGHPFVQIDGHVGVQATDTSRRLLCWADGVATREDR